MKKLWLIFFSLIICTLSVSAKPKPIKQAEKLIGNFAQRDQARKYVEEALSDSLTGNLPVNHFIAGRIEKEVYRHYYKLLSINKNDPAVDHQAMADALMKAYSEFVKTMSLDTTYDKKGNIKVNYSPQISEWISTIAPAVYNAGIAYMNKQAYYPGAYNAFMTYASLPEQSFYRPSMVHITDSLRANACFYGGVMAYNAKHYREAAIAFEKARKLGYNKKEVFLNEMSCLANIARQDTLTVDSLSMAVTALARDGYDKFGFSQPIFIQKYIAGLMLSNKCDSALNVLDRALLMNDAPLTLLHTLKGAVLAATGDASGSAAEYLIACTDPDAPFSTLQKGSQQIAMVGLTLIDSVNGSKKEIRQRKKKIKQEYLIPALEFAQRGATLKPDDEIIRNTIETVSYHLH